MAAMPIYSKSPLNIYSLEPKDQWPWTWYVALEMLAVCTNDGSGLSLTFFPPRPNLIPNAFILEKS